CFVVRLNEGTEPSHRRECHGRKLTSRLRRVPFRMSSRCSGQFRKTPFKVDRRRRRDVRIAERITWFGCCVSLRPEASWRWIPSAYQNGTMTAITDNYGWATSINDAGEVTGFVLLPGQPNVHAFRYRNGVFTDVGALPGFSNEPFSIGWAINNSGTIAGASNG